jgi:hypothetical protein
LQRILTIDPADSSAHAFLNKLGASFPPVADSENGNNGDANVKKKTSPITHLLLIFQIFIFAAIIGLVGYGGYSLYYWIFPDRTIIFSDDYTITNSFNTIHTDNLEWQIIFEKSRETTFTGLVRHTSDNRINQLPLLTHDILITTGDYADSQLVSTNVTNHHFRWFSNNEKQPKGTINLLHTFPSNEDVFKQLESIKNNDEVQIKGQEILAIKIFKEGEYIGEWRDDGCNTLLVKTVTNK